MAHTTTHTKISYTINRGGFYYLNLRKNELTIRLFLKTDFSYAALIITNIMSPSLNDNSNNKSLRMGHKQISNKTESVRHSLEVDDITVFYLEIRN
jgi:hypothetical protein